MDPKDPVVVVTSEREIRDLLSKALEDLLPSLIEEAAPSPQSPPSDEIEWLSNAEAREYLDLSKSTLQRYRSRGVLSYSKLEGNIFYRRSELDAVLEENRVGTAGEPDGSQKSRA